MTLKKKPDLAFYVLQLDRIQQDPKGGTGIEITTMVNVLTSLSWLSVEFVPFPSQPTYCHSTLSFVTLQISEVRNLLAPSSKFLFFIYPKMPFLGYPGVGRTIPFAALGYVLLALKKKITRQRIIVLITDLPAEQHLMNFETNSYSELAVGLDHCRHWSLLPWKERFLFIFERFIFRQADIIISLSTLMTEHIIKKHALKPSKILQRGHHGYFPTYQSAPENIEVVGEGLRIFYSGNLVTPDVTTNIRKIIEIFKNNPKSNFYLCGKGGEWLGREISRFGLQNVHYLGVLDFATHDAVAQQCDVGLIAYTQAYTNLGQTAKYSAYLANGLAVLSTDLITLRETISQDQVGVTVPIANLPQKLNEWLENPGLVKPYKEQAKKLSIKFRQGNYTQNWMEEVFRIRVAEMG